MGTNTRPELSVKNRYWLPKHRFYELRHFCLQYPDWKKSYMSLDGLPTRSSLERSAGGLKVSDPTAMYSEARIFFKDRMEMVEDAAEEAVADLGPLLLKAVTEGLSYETVSPPCCKEVWYTGYRRFFWLLDKARK